MELSWIHGITESPEKSTEMSVVLDYSHPMVPSLVHGVNKTRKHWHCCIFQIVFSIPIYPLQRDFYPLKICLIPLNYKRVVYCLQWAYKNKRTEQIYPQFQNAVGILILTAVLSLNFQARQNREKKRLYIRLYIQAHYNLKSQCTKCQHWFHPVCQDIKLKACQLKHSRTVGCFEC